MKGFTLSINGKKVSGAIEDGGTGILVTYQDNCFRLFFSSVDKKGVSYVWHSIDLTPGDSFEIIFEAFTSIPEPESIIDYEKLSQEELLKLKLDNYHRLRKELVEEGVL